MKRRIFKRRKAITPVIAIVLLLMMTVAAAGGAYVWITKISQQLQDRTTQQMGKDMSFKGITCNATTDNVTITLYNTGEKAIDTSPVNVLVYDYATGEFNQQLSQSNLDTVFAGADFMQPGKFDTKTVDVSSGDLIDGTRYTVELGFPEDSFEGISTDCKAKE